MLRERLEKISADPHPQVQELEFLLGAEDPHQVREILDFADAVRRRFVGEGILLRGLIEFSNHCCRDCFYCGLNCGNNGLRRYRMSEDEILEGVKHIADCGIKTVVLQSGEDPRLKAEWLAGLISRIKERFALAVTLSVGERSYADYKLWKQAGADRYLLKIETSDPGLYASLHRGMDFGRRLECLRNLKSLGYQTGSGNIVGLKGQILESIARDIIFFKNEGLEMLGIGPFIPHAQTPLAKEEKGEAGLVLKTVALARIVCRWVNIPATTALGSLDSDHRLEALRCGANVLMPNFTPQPYRKLYEIYPGKICLQEAPGACLPCISGMAEACGRFVDYSRGDVVFSDDSVSPA